MARPGSEHRNGLGAGSEFAGREDKAAIREALAPSNSDHAGDVGPRNEQGDAFRNSGRYVGQQSFAPTGGSFCLKCGAWLGCLGLEPTVGLFIEHLVEVFREVRRVMHDSATLWCNMGDSLADKQLQGVPWRLAFALQADGWWLRSDIIWAKGASFCKGWSGSVMPESCRDRPTSAHEHLFLLAKSRKYFYDSEAVRERASGGAHPQGRGTGQKHERPGQGVRNNTSFTAAIHNPTQDSLPSTRNLRNVWAIGTSAYREAHFAVYAPALVEPCVKAGAGERGCCPACGMQWVRVVERKNQSTYARLQAEGYDYREGKAESVRKGVTVTSVGQTHGPGRRSETYASPDNRTVGWRPTCSHGTRPRVALYYGGSSTVHVPHEPVPCIVLDPFFGSGTTGLVARRLGRDYIGCEASAEYAAMARQRIADDDPSAAVESLPPDAPLFAKENADG